MNRRTIEDGVSRINKRCSSGNTTRKIMELNEYILKLIYVIEDKNEKIKLREDTIRVLVKNI